MEQTLLGDGTWRASATLEEISSFKRLVFNGRPYADRTSIGFTLRMNAVIDRYGTHQYVVDAIDHLEGLSGVSATKPPTQFRDRPLHPFWHKHFTTPKHIIQNIYAHWGLLKAAEGDQCIDQQQKSRFDKLFSEVANECGDDPDKWPLMIAHRFVVEGFQRRGGRRKLTGDWIIFAKHEGRNYYLDVASHREDDAEIYRKIRNGSEAEFPFLFHD